MQPPVVGVPVQEQVHQPGLPEPPVEVIGVPQVLVVGESGDVVADGSGARRGQPALHPSPQRRVVGGEMYL